MNKNFFSSSFLFCTNVHWAKEAQQELSVLHMFGTLAHLGPPPLCCPMLPSKEKKTLWRHFPSQHRSPQRFNFASSLHPLFGFSSQAEQSLDSESKTHCARSKNPEGNKNRSACFAICSDKKGQNWRAKVGGWLWELSLRLENRGIQLKWTTQTAADNTGGQ